MFKDSKISVLDVGSCYNPFKEFEELDVLPVDLCPALESVYQCDFLTVPVGAKTFLEDQSVFSLASSSFHCVGNSIALCSI
jgi:25S rRNA (adenine2142-N1)-methyltransferase